MSTPSDTTAPASRLLWWGAAASALLMVAGGAAFAYASIRAGDRAAGDADAVLVTLQDGTCQPNAITVPAGRSMFRIVNRTDRAVEWEILDGVMVVEERENIAPGLSQTLSARLREGTYAITCGLLSNPRGTLTVTPSASDDASARPTLTAFIGALAEYQVYLAMQGGEVVRGAQALDDAIRTGNLADARAAYVKARAPYLRVEPVAARFADLRDAIDPSAFYLAGREADPAFTGYHRLEYGLFHGNGLDGLVPISAKLLTDVGALKDRLRTAKLGPDEMAEGAVRSLRAMADTGVPAGVSPYAGGDLAEFEAQLAGIRKIEALLKPVAALSAAAPLADVEKALAAADADLGSMREGAASYAAIAPERRAKFADSLRTAADAMERLNAALGLTEGGA